MAAKNRRDRMTRYFEKSKIGDAANVQHGEARRKLRNDRERANKNRSHLENHKSRIIRTRVMLANITNQRNQEQVLEIEIWKPGRNELTICLQRTRIGGVAKMTNRSNKGDIHYFDRSKLDHAVKITKRRFDRTAKITKKPNYLRRFRKKNIEVKTAHNTRRAKHKADF